MRILATADIHIGRRPAGLPADLAGRFSAAHMWERIVAFAVKEQVDALLLAGDVIDQDNKYYEALAPLESGCRMLADHGIPVLAVTGNHDFDVFEEVADALDSPNFHLLGRHGQWEKFVLKGAAGEEMQVFGWSFPDGRVTESPISSFPVTDIDQAVPALGLLHADLDVTGSYYAPVRQNELTSVPVDGWILGHVHLPQLFQTRTQQPWIMYPGSPQGTDMGIGDRGLHGVGLIERGEKRPQAEMVLLAPLVYDELEIELGPEKDAAGLRETLVKALRLYAQKCREASDHIEAACLRLRLHGRCTLTARDVEQECRELASAISRFEDMSIVVSDCTVNIRPPVNLPALARGTGILAETARLLQQLTDDNGEGGVESVETLISAVQEDVKQVTGSNTFSVLPAESTEALADREECRRRVTEEAWRLLDVLLRQREAAV
jgi:exonuclease SbcD